MRVGAICKIDLSGNVLFFGYGKYLGREQMPKNIIPGYEGCSPKIQLDNGDIVWGAECCMWDTEESIKHTLKMYSIQGFTITIKNVNDFRSERFNYLDEQYLEEE